MSRTRRLLRGSCERIACLVVAAGFLLAWLVATPVVAQAAPTPPVQEGRALWTAPLPPGWGVTRPFQPPASRYGPGHRGVDLSAVPGAVVLAAGAGRVSYAGPLAGRGVVVVTHDGPGVGLRTTYEPVEALVSVGDEVQPGQPLGRLAAGHLGCPVRACLHWGLIRGHGDDEAYLDPLVLLGRARVRLLPLEPADGRIRAAVTLSSAQAPAVRLTRVGGPVNGPPPPALATGAGIAGLALLARRRGR